MLHLSLVATPGRLGDISLLPRVSDMRAPAPLHTDLSQRLGCGFDADLPAFAVVDLIGVRKHRHARRFELSAEQRSRTAFGDEEALSLRSAEREIGRANA